MQNLAHSVSFHSGEKIAPSKPGIKQGRSIPFVVVGARGRLAKGQWQTRLGTVECLDLALLVHAEHQCTIRRGQIEPHHIAHLVHEMRIRGQLECLLQMRFEPEGMPDTLDRCR